ncbi:alpha/beta fold hydrolase [Streptomyces sp. NPDC051909]|uniref:alpha/beta fold hydrolase n=1 Tax=Streptomyces sp. NPDC051909 TaxID=3154944 RepID=UPI00342F1F44
MPHAAHLLHHAVDGPEDAPLLVLGPSLGTSTAVWEPHLDRLSGEFRTLRFDLPGHGGSSAAAVPDPRVGRTTMADLARLVLDLAELHGHRAFHYAGISIGGAIGAQLAVHHPERVNSLALVSSAAYFGGFERWHERSVLVRREGTAPLLDAAPGRWFGDPATARTPHGASLLQTLVHADPVGYSACCDALATFDLRAELGRVTAPTLVVAGSRDTATPAGAAAELAGGIPTASLVTIDSGHLPSADEAPALTSRLYEHLTTVKGADGV